MLSYRKNIWKLLKQVCSTISGLQTIHTVKEISLVSCNRKLCFSVRRDLKKTKRKTTCLLLPFFTFSVSFKGFVIQTWLSSNIRIVTQNSGLVSMTVILPEVLLRPLYKITSNSTNPGRYILDKVLLRFGSLCLVTARNRSRKFIQVWGNYGLWIL